MIQHLNKYDSIVLSPDFIAQVKAFKITRHTVSLLKRMFFIIVLYIICKQNFVFPSSPKFTACSPVPLKKWDLFPCSPEINGLVPLFPKTPGRASLSLIDVTKLVTKLCYSPVLSCNIMKSTVFKQFHVLPTVLIISVPIIETVLLAEPQYPTIHKMPRRSILCTLPTQYATREHIVYPTYTICSRVAYCESFANCVISLVVRGYTLCSTLKKWITFFARLHIVQRALVVTSIVGVLYEISILFTMRQSFPDVHILTTMTEK